MRLMSWLCLPLALSLATASAAASPAAALDTSIRLLQLESFGRGPLEPNPTAGPSRTPFQVLEKRFEDAKGVALEELKGWYGGRCYFPDAPTSAVASVLITDARADAATHGPAFAGSENRKFVPLIDRTVRPDRFDRLESRDREEVKRALARAGGKLSFAVRSNETLVVAGLRTTDEQAREYRLRRAGRFLIMRLTCAEPSYCLNPHSGSGASRVLGYEGDATAICYYFRPRN